MGSLMARARRHGGQFLRFSPLSNTPLRSELLRAPLRLCWAIRPIAKLREPEGSDLSNRFFRVCTFWEHHVVVLFPEIVFFRSRGLSVLGTASLQLR